MRKFSLEQYIEMAGRFNKMSFYNKIKTIKENSDILTLASDHNWWGVKIKDKGIWEEFNEEYEFQIEKEWDASEMCDLVSLLGIDNMDI
jgi:hypothetical protein